MAYYQAGHMMYIDQGELQKMKIDLDATLMTCFRNLDVLTDRPVGLQQRRRRVYGKEHQIPSSPDRTAR